MLRVATTQQGFDRWPNCESICNSEHAEERGKREKRKERRAKRKPEVDAYWRSVWHVVPSVDEGCRRWDGMGEWGAWPSWAAIQKLFLGFDFGFVGSFFAFNFVYSFEWPQKWHLHLVSALFPLPSPLLALRPPCQHHIHVPSLQLGHMRCIPRGAKLDKPETDKDVEGAARATGCGWFPCGACPNLVTNECHIWQICFDNWEMSAKFME